MLETTETVSKNSNNNIQNLQNQQLPLQRELCSIISCATVQAASVPLSSLLLLSTSFLWNQHQSPRNSCLVFTATSHQIVPQNFSISSKEAARGIVWVGSEPGSRGLRVTARSELRRAIVIQSAGRLESSRLFVCSRLLAGV